MALGSTLESIEEAREQSKQRNTRDRITTDLLEAVADAGNPTHQDLLTRVKGKDASKLEALAGLVEVGMVARSGAGTRMDPYRYALRKEVVQAPATP
jgi:hypothetical protein